MIRCMIIDPDVSSRKALSREISRNEHFSIVGIYDSPESVPFAINRITTDVLFIEIALRGQKGLDYIRKMDNPPVTVITTAYREYAVECFELDIVDYLVKPVEPARLRKTLDKMERVIPELKKNAPLRRETTRREGDYLFIRVDKKQVKLFFADILFVESIKDYICIHLPSVQYVIHQTLSSFTQALPPDKFIRIHRSYTVSLQWIDAISGSTVQLGGHNLPIGRNYLAAARQKILGE